MIIPEGLWHSLLTTPPLPAPSSQMRWKSSSLISPTLAFWVRKASNLFFCCSSRSNSSNILLSASKLALWIWIQNKNQASTRCHKWLQFKTTYEDTDVVPGWTYSDATSELVEVDNPSPEGAIFKGIGLFLGAMLTCESTMSFVILLSELQLLSNTSPRRDFWLGNDWLGKIMLCVISTASSFISLANILRFNSALSCRCYLDLR